MTRLGLTPRELLIPCVYAIVVVVLIGGAFFGVQALLPPQATVFTPPNNGMPLGKVQAGAPRELPPIQEGKAEKPVYVPTVVSADPSLPAEAEREQVQRAPDPETVTAPSRVVAPFVPPDIHRPQ